MIRYNVALNPELATICLGEVRLIYTQHAQEKAIEKSPVINIKEGSVVELEREDGQVGFNKVVVRIPYNNICDKVLVLVPTKMGKYLVITQWLNHKNDAHATLNHKRLGKLDNSYRKVS